MQSPVEGLRLTPEQLAKVNALRVHKNQATNKQKAFEVWQRDQYNQNTIVAETDTLEEAFAAARRFVDNENRNNSLTFDEQKRNWKYFLPLIADVNGNVVPNVFYAGNLVHGRHKALVKTANGIDEQPIDIAKAKLRFYLGELPGGKGPWLYEDARKRVVDRIDHPDVLGKTTLFIQKVRAKATL